MKAKRALTALAAVALAIGLCVPTVASAPAFVEQDKANITDPGTFPVTDNPVKFRVFTQNSGATVEDLATNAYNKWQSDKTNVHIEWDTVTSGASQRIPVLIMSGDLPDAIMGNISDSQILQYAMIEKVFVPIDEAIDKYAPNTKKMLEDYELARDYAYLPDGHIYSMLRVVDTYNERIDKRAWVYQPWLDELGIELPQTTEEFYNMLVAFKDHDPSGTGVKDAVPFSGAMRNNPANNEPESFLLGSFMYYDSTFIEVLEDGETLAFTGFSDGYREGLKYLNKLYKEGLLDKETWTQDRNGLKALTEGGDYNRLGAAAAMYWGHITTEGGIERNGERLRRDLEFVAIPVLEGPDGQRNAHDRGMLVNNGKLLVTNACKNPDLLVRWADMFFDADAMMEAGYNANMGPEGVGWRKAEAGELTWEGTQAKYAILRPVDVKQNDNWFQVEPYYESREFIMSFAQNDASRKEGFGGAETTEKYVPYSALEKRLPFMYPPEDEALLMEYTDLKPFLTDATTGLLSTWRNQFIVGQKDPNNDGHWNDYIKQATRAGAEEWLEINQTMYDAYLENKK